MRKNVLMLLVLLTVSYANAQIYKPNNTKVMSKFDIKEYEKMPKSPKTGLYIDKYGYEIDIIFLETYKVVWRYLQGERYEYYQKYDNNNNLTESATYFGNFRIKKTYYYDLFGYVIKEVDEEKDFPVTLDKLREIILKNLKVDIALSENRNYDISRLARNKDVGNIPTYEIYITNFGSDPYEYYLIDARTGELIFHTKGVFFDQGIEKYLEHKKGLGR